MTGKPVPKVIDFGVAKAIGQQLTEKTLFTAYGMMVRYAAVHESGTSRNQWFGCGHAERRLLTWRPPI